MCSILLLATLLLSLATYDCQGYSYPPPQIPLHQNSRVRPIYGPPPPAASNTVPCTDNTSPETSLQIPVVTAVVRSLGPPGRNYEVKLSPSNQVSSGQGVIPPHVDKLTATTINAPGNFHYANSATNHLPPQAQLQPHYQAFTGGPAQQYGNSPTAGRPPYTTHYNPLLTPQHAHQIQHSPFGPPAPQVFPNQGNPLHQQQFSSATQNNNFNLAGGTSSSQLAYQQSQNTPGSAADGSTLGVPGDYISQSEVGQLDHYFEKQNPVGDTRAYSRIINTCYPDGHCEQKQLGAGQVDQRHQHVVLTARARVQPISDKCRALAGQGVGAGQGSGVGQGAVRRAIAGSVSVGSSLVNSLQRPPNRRLYPYTEVGIPRDPFN